MSRSRTTGPRAPIRMSHPGFPEPQTTPCPDCPAAVPGVGEHLSRQDDQVGAVAPVEVLGPDELRHRCQRRGGPRSERAVSLPEQDGYIRDARRIAAPATGDGHVIMAITV